MFWQTLEHAGRPASCMFLQFPSCKVASRALACHPHNQTILWNNWPNLWADAIIVTLHYFTLQNNQINLPVHAINVILHQSMQVIWGSTLWSQASCSSLRWNNWANLLAIYVGFSRIAVRTENWAICGWFMSNLKPGCTLHHRSKCKLRFTDLETFSA